MFVRTPDIDGDFASAGWATPSAERLRAEHEAFVALLTDLGCDVELGAASPGQVDAVYTHDPVIMTPHGAIVLRMRKPARRDEPATITADLERMGVPILGTLTGDAVSDGGDKVWFDDRTLAIGRGYRTNDEAIRQIRDLLEPHGVEIAVYDTPHFRGPGEVLHLMSVISPVADDLAVVFAPLVPTRLMEFLADRGIACLSVDDEEFDRQGGNILAIRPGEVVIPAGNPKITTALAAAGCTVHEFAGDDLCIKGTGGPTCLTQPIWRAA